MSTPSAAATLPRTWQRRSPAESLRTWLAFMAMAALVAWSVNSLDIEWGFFADAHEQAIDLASRMWPPRWSYLPKVLQPLIETIHIATLGTAIAVVLSRCRWRSLRRATPAPTATRGLSAARSW